jgi:hypothetical protein
MIPEIHPYNLDGVWFFDDERVGLEREPFIAGADLTIDRMVADLPNAAEGFVSLFRGPPSRGVNSNWCGRSRTPGDTGITRRRWRCGAGSARLCSGIFARLRNGCMPRFRLKNSTSIYSFVDSIRRTSTGSFTGLGAGVPLSGATPAHNAGEAWGSGGDI